MLLSPAVIMQWKNYFKEFDLSIAKRKNHYITLLPSPPPPKKNTQVQVIGMFVHKRDRKKQKKTNQIKHR